MSSTTTRSSQALPGAAVQLADRACALVRMSGEGHIQLDGVSADRTLSPDDVMVATSRLTRIPVTKLSEDVPEPRVFGGAAGEDVA